MLLPRPTPLGPTPKSSRLSPRPGRDINAQPKQLQLVIYAAPWRDRSPAQDGARESRECRHLILNFAALHIQQVGRTVRSSGLSRRSRGAEGWREKNEEEEKEKVAVVTVAQEQENKGN